MELLGLCLFLTWYFIGTILSGIGLSLFVIESPYVKFIPEWIEKQTYPSQPMKYLQPILIKGLRCFTCTGFFGGAGFGLLLWYFINLFLVPSLAVTLLLVFMSACMGSAASTIMKYTIEYYFLLKDFKADNLPELKVSCNDDSIS